MVMNPLKIANFICIAIVALPLLAHADDPLAGDYLYAEDPNKQGMPMVLINNQSTLGFDNLVESIDTPHCSVPSTPSTPSICTYNIWLAPKGSRDQAKLLCTVTFENDIPDSILTISKANKNDTVDPRCPTGKFNHAINPQNGQRDSRSGTATNIPFDDPAAVAQAVAQ
jgi:hypothetical protein